MDNQNALALNARVGTSYNQYFNWNNNTAFYVLAPAYLFQFYNTQMRIWDMWNVGWVQSFHSIETGILPTQFAGSLCKKLATLINGDGVLFESLLDKNANNTSLDFINDLDKRVDIKGRFKDAILKSVTLGNSILKLNCDDDGELWVDALAGNRFFINIDSKGAVKSALSYVNIYTSGIKQAGQDPDSYGLVELRYYDEKKVPMVVYKIYKMRAVANVFDPNPSESSYSYENLPRSVQKAFRFDYSDMKLNVPHPLGIGSIGIYHVKHTEYVNAMPNIKMGESALSQIINYLPQYDAINSEALIDLRISRPKMIIPDFMSKGKVDNQDQLNTLDNIIFTKVPNRSDKEQVPTSFIPIPREQHFTAMKEDLIKKICGNIGVATSSIFSDIADGRGNVTAREISSEESNTVNYVNDKRRIVLPAFNNMIKDILRYYGKKEDVQVSFAPAGSSNRSVTTEITTKLYAAGLISQYQAIKEQHPDWTDNQVLEEIDEIEKTLEKKKELNVGKGGEDEDTDKGDNKNSGEEEKKEDKVDSSAE